MLAIGGALLAGAAILALLAYLARRWYLQRGIAALWPRVVATRAGEPITAAGIAVAGPGGLVESRLARIDCVWHGHEVLRHYWSLPRHGDERERGCDPIADHASTELFGIVAPGRRARKGCAVLVDPKGAELSGADMCLQRVVGRPQQGVPAPADDLLARVKGRISGIFRGETIEFEYREWVIRPGAPIAVHGVVELRDGRPVIVPPPGGRLRIERGNSDGPGVPAPVPKGAEALLFSGGITVLAFMGLLVALNAV